MAWAVAARSRELAVAVVLLPDGVVEVLAAVAAPVGVEAWELTADSDRFTCCQMRTAGTVRRLSRNRPRFFFDSRETLVPLMDPKVRGNLPPLLREGEAPAEPKHTSTRRNLRLGGSLALPGLAEASPFQGEHRALHRNFALILPFLIAEDVL